MLFSSAPSEIVVVGHVCLDVIPLFETREGAPPPVLRPGHLVNVGPALRSTGGAVSNTGLALHRLGVPVSLLGKIGDDLFGEEILRLFRAAGPLLADGMTQVSGEVTSYSIAISPPGMDRTFLHCPGANDTFVADDVDLTRFAGARLLHFGYPPIMREMFLNNGRELVTLLQRARSAGMTTSLDLCMVDPEAEAGRVDWQAYLASVLPHVDLFCPSIDELLFMLERELFEQALAQGGLDVKQHVTTGLLRQLAERCLRQGAAMVLIKLGDEGLYLRTSSDDQRIAQMGRAAPRDFSTWTSRELLSPCLMVDVQGTTGSGDCTIAGFLAAILRGEAPEEAICGALAVGAASVEAPDAVSGIPHWNELAERLRSGWSYRPSNLFLDA